MVTHEQLRELQHFARLGRMSASLLHEISHPLTAALLNLEMSDQQSQGVKRARNNIHVLRRYVEAARQQVRHNGRPTSFYVQTQLNQLQQIVQPLADRAGVRLDIRSVPNCQLRGDPVKFQHIITNLIVNAIEAYPDNAPGPALVQVTTVRSCGWITIRVNDWGKGIPAKMVPRIFETFYTTKNQPGRGLGIGLSTVKHYVTVDFQGSIKVSSSPEQGTKFTVKLQTTTAKLGKSASRRSRLLSEH